jgi:RecG-like helicase
VALIACINVISSGFQVCLMAPTEILARQHYNQANKLFDKNTNIKLLTSKTEYKERKLILNDLNNNVINILIGTHSLFQEKIKYNNDLKSNEKMFRLLQGDVGSGKTIVALIACINVISSGFQVCLMAPTEILARQHYNQANKLFDKNTNIKLLTSKTEYKERKLILNDLNNNVINILIGTHSLFQEKIKYNNDLKSNEKMFRLLQGDVGSGKTIVALIACINVISSGFQVCLMAPTEILARQHYNQANKLFDKNTNIKLLTSKTEYKERKLILNDLNNNVINILIGTHSLFQEKITYFNLGLIIIDEQHKFGVNQRKKLSDKGGKSC